MAEKQKTEIDAGLLKELRRITREQSRTEGELLEEIVRRYLVLAPRRSNSAEEFFEKVSAAGAKRASNCSPRMRPWSSPTRSCAP